MANFNKIARKPHNEIVVAKKGGDESRIAYALLQAKNIAAAVDGDSAPITVRVYPGTYKDDTAITVWNNTILYGVSEGAVIVEADITMETDGQIYNIEQPDTFNFIQL